MSPDVAARVERPDGPVSGGPVPEPALAPGVTPLGRPSDRVLRALRREPVDTTPAWFMRQAGRALPEYRAIREGVSLQGIVADPALCVEVTLQPVTRLRVDAAILFADITTPLAGMGVDVRMAEGVGPVIDRPIRMAADVEALRPLAPEEAVGPLLEAVRILRRESPVPVLGFAGAPFTLASYLVEGRSSREAARLLALMRRDPATFDALMTRLTDATIAYLAAQVAAGVQAVQVFDSWVGVLGPYDYERRVLAHMRRLFAGLRPLGVPVIHFGTGTAGLLHLMAGAGSDAIGLDWRVDLGRAWDELERVASGEAKPAGEPLGSSASPALPEPPPVRYAPRLAVQGNLDPSLLLGPFEDVAAQARAILHAAAGRPGHVFNLGHGVLPATDPDDLRRLVDLVHEEGRAR